MSNGQNETDVYRDYPARIKVRENIRLMSEANLNRYRLTVEKLMNICDDRGYGYIATVHGGANAGRPFGQMPIYCEHGTDNFLTWHRPYIYQYEQRLQDIDPEVTVPYWDWTDSESIANGIPQAFLDETYVDPETGETKPNPLRKWKDLQQQPSGDPSGTCGWDNYPDTLRDADSSSELDDLRLLVEEALEEDQFLDFTRALENPHNRLHVWVNGTMSTFQSSYDPIFWSHHANVDRQFWQWQKLYGNASIPNSVRNFICNPFGTRVEDILDVHDLGYTYGSSAQMVARGDAVVRSAEELGLETALPEAMSFEFGPLKYHPSKARLYFYGLHHTVESYEVRVYVNNPNADVTVGRDPNSGYLGSLYLFGHGDCVGGAGHCDIPKGRRRRFDIRPQHHLTPYDTFINISRNLSAITSGASATSPNEVNLSFVVIDRSKRQVSPSDIEFDNIALIFDP